MSEDHQDGVGLRAYRVQHCGFQLQKVGFALERFRFRVWGITNQDVQAPFFQWRSLHNTDVWALGP